MATILEMAADIVAAHASTTNMTKEELVSELNEIYNALITLEKGDAVLTALQKRVDLLSHVKKLSVKTIYIA